MLINLIKKVIFSSNFHFKDISRIQFKLRKKLVISTLHGNVTRKYKSIFINSTFIKLMKRVMDKNDNKKFTSSEKCDYNKHNIRSHIDSNLRRVQSDERKNIESRQESIQSSTSWPATPQLLPPNFVINPFNLYVNHLLGVSLNNVQISNSSYIQNHGTLKIHNKHPDVFTQNSRTVPFRRKSRWDQYSATSSSGATIGRSLNGARYWEHFKIGQDKPGFVFSVMSYNVLAQELLSQHPYLYRSCHSRNLKWDVRWHNLFAEVTESLPEIICFQEVQNYHLIPNFVEYFKPLGYDYIFKQRTGIRTDGCAIFYKTNSIKLIESATVEFYQAKAPVLDRDNVAVIGKFAPKDHPTNEFVVATTHLLYNPKRVDVRLAQTQLLLAEVDRIAFKSSNTASNQYTPIIITGDLNSLPNSEVYQLITRGKINYANIPRKSYRYNVAETKGIIPSTLQITDQCQHATLLANRKSKQELPRSEEIKLVHLEHSERPPIKESDAVENAATAEDKLFSSGFLSHQFSFQSVYSHGDLENDPEGTTYQDQWISVDYIFYSQMKEHSNQLQLIGRYRLPAASQLQNIRIPNECLGSDHLSLIAQFKLNV